MHLRAQYFLFVWTEDLFFDLEAIKIVDTAFPSQRSYGGIVMRGVLSWYDHNRLDEVSHKYQVNSPASIATLVKVGGLSNHPLFETRTTYLLSKIEQNRIYLSNIFTLMAILLVSAWFIQTFQLNPNHQHRILICRYSSSSLSRRRF